MIHSGTRPFQPVKNSILHLKKDFGKMIPHLLLLFLLFLSHCNAYVKHRNMPLRMSLRPIDINDMKILSPRKVNTDQWKSYWGNNKVERLQKVLESILLSYGGTWMAWFLSFMAGAYVSAFVGTALIFNWMYTPWFYARKRNSNIWPRNKKLYYALYTGRIVSLNRVKRRAGKTIGGVAQEYLVLRIDDEDGRDLEIITQWCSSYSNLRKLMKCEAIIASPRVDYSLLTSVTEIYVPACDDWIGDYPYLQRNKFKRYLDETKNQAKETINNSFVNSKMYEAEENIEEEEDTGDNYDITFSRSKSKYDDNRSYDKVFNERVINRNR